MTNWVTLITVTLSGLAAIAAPWLVATVIAPGFTAAQQAETVAVMRIVLISTIIFGISAVQASALHGFKHFLLPALAAAAYPLGIIAGALWLAPTLRRDGAGDGRSHRRAAQPGDQGSRLAALRVPLVAGARPRPPTPCAGWRS